MLASEWTYGRNARIDVIESWKLFSAHAEDCDACEEVAYVVRSQREMPFQELWDEACEAGREPLEMWDCSCKMLKMEMEERATNALKTGGFRASRKRICGLPGCEIRFKVSVSEPYQTYCSAAHRIEDAGRG